ncbi:helix-turn-helix transcriptional regulator [Patulibacter sp. NPDC049589]|uniref:helix-turn-helix transcriptional regulator n=1 Tax=Patulibacter sp. NPDC049589 TaxID=3154731 RepID=UPI00342D26CF
MSGPGAARADKLVARADRLERRADALAGDAPDHGTPERDELDGDAVSLRAERLADRIATALGVLARAGSATTDPVPPGDDVAPRSGDATKLARLSVEAHELALEAHAFEAAAARRRVTSCERGLTRMRTITTAAELLDAVCDEVADSCGFERVLLSRVDDDAWSPWMVNAAVRDAPWWRAWDERPIPVTEVPFESQLVAEHRPGLVTDTSDAGAHRFFHEGRSSSYVAAPIAASGTVVAFLHADHDSDARCDAIDRDLLWMFAEGFAHLFERAALTESMRHQRDEVRAVLADVDAAMAAMTETELRLARPGLADDDPVEPEPSTPERARRLAALTPREHEVLAMIASGARNAEIARALAISDPTVKTHVRRVLAKLGVRNRTQAIAWVMGDGRPASP